MKTDYQNTEPDKLSLPTTISFPAENAEKIVELMKESDIKCIVNSDEKKTDITFSVEDIEKLNKLLQSVGIDKHLNNSALQFPKIEKKEKLIPIANAISNLYDRKINGRNSRIESHKKHIGTLSAELTKCSTKVQTLKETELMLVKAAMTFPVFKVPINALIKHNEKKIERFSNDILKLEKQIRIHQTTIDKLSKSEENYKVRKSACKHLSDVVKSFSIRNRKDRNQTYLTALSSLNNNIQQINNDKIKSCIEAISKTSENFSELPLVQQKKAQERITNLIRTKNTLEEKNKILQTAQPDILKMLAELNDDKTTAVIDKAEIMFNQAIADSGMSLDSVIVSAAVENSRAVSPTAAEIAQVEISVLGNINDKDGDLIPDRLDSTFNPKVTENNEKIPVSNIEEIQSENTQTQEIRAESDDNFDAMLEKYKDQIPPNDYDYEPEPPPDDYIDADNTFNQQITKKAETLDKKTEQTDKTDSKIYLVTDEELNVLKKTEINPKVNRKQISENGKIPVLIETKDKDRFEEILNNLKKSKENKVVKK